VRKLIIWNFDYGRCLVTMRKHLSPSPCEQGLICVFRFSRNMQMNLMIRITRSFLSLISFAMSVINEASITPLSLRSQRCEQEITKPDVLDFITTS